MRAGVAILSLTGVLLLAGTVLGLTRLATGERIARNAAEAERAAVAAVLGNDVSANAVLCRASGNGYAGRLSVMVGRVADALVGVRVLSHRETPGIGDFIDRSRSPWIEQFAGLQFSADPASTSAAWDRALDATTGATVTRRALLKMIAEQCQPEANGESSE